MDTYPIGINKWELDTPALCLDADRLERNIARMSDYLRDKPVALRPHTKTHKCPTIAWMQLRAGAIGVTCAKLGEAEVMARKAYSMLDKAARKGVIHSGNASRRKGRLMARLEAAKAAANG